MITERRIFTVAVLAALAHALDDAFVNRGAGLGLGQHALAGAIALAAAVAGVLAFPRLRPGLRAALAFSFGGLAIVNGALHVLHIGKHGATGGDFTGALAFAAGLVLIGLAAAIPFRHRGAGERPWRARAVAVPVALVGFAFVLVPVGMGVVASHKWRSPIGDPPSAAYRDVAFEASDGLDLEGWYRPSENGANVLVVHGGSSDRDGSVAHAEMLAAHGYGVLLYDARGRGESDGSENNYGWDWAKDIDGALAFLKAQDGVDPERIGALGLSTGADVLIQVAAERSDLRALVTDGAAAGSFEDGHRLRGTGPETPVSFLMFATIGAITGDRPGPALEDAITRLKSPTLMVSAGTAIERDFNVHYDEVAGDRPVEHWNLPDVNHTDAIYEARDEYERRVVAFLDGELSR
jgi:dienelactone hydrolase